MNIAMTELQDQLGQSARAGQRQNRRTLTAHEARGAQLLRDLDIKDALWLQTVRQASSRSGHPAGFAEPAASRSVWRIC